MTHEEARKIEDMIEKRVYHILDNDAARRNYLNVLDAQILFGNRSFEALQVAYQEVCAEMGHIGTTSKKAISTMSTNMIATM